MDDEIDMTLIDTMLRLSPDERVRQNDQVLRSIQELRDGLTRAAQHPQHPRER